MTEKLRMELTASGADVCEGLRICMNMEPLYEKLLVMFVADKNFAMMQEAIEKDECEKAYEYAHALKGMSANIGFKHLYDPLIQMMADMKGKDIGCVKERFTDFVERYNDTCRVIKANMKVQS